MLVALETGKVDMVLSAMTPTATREKSVDFSKVYYKAGQNFIINKSDEGVYKDKDSFKGKKVGVQTGSLQADLLKQQVPEAQSLGLARCPI